MTGFAHTSVLVDEVLAALAPRPGGLYADLTVGGGGHAAAVLERSAPDGRLIGLDRDPAALAAARARLAPFGDRVTLVHSTLSRLPEVLDEARVDALDGVLADLGVSSPQLDVASRGFSFAEDGPLDMRMDPTRGETALDLIARLDADALADVLFEYGEERRSRPVARSIRAAYDAGELHTTGDLRRAVVRVLGPKRGRIDPATRTFQALRIAVNQELDELRALVGALPDVLGDGGVAAIISFHSLEDRIVKRAFRDDPRLTPLSKKPLVPTETERAQNPRARPAKLRAARRRARTLDRPEAA
ncbi:MAG: 16S rRNA (cytosine(1402)-N(4))-methyltransferase RsmH [Myxococcales bacterium]|nr:16S rRNA (cytosine(1402)-N(4))-methyltransferase RsmH [Myxococcales bacterium]